jgi:hypothetical protein
LILKRPAWSIDVRARAFRATAIKDSGHDDSEVRESCTAPNREELLFPHVGVFSSGGLRKRACGLDGFNVGCSLSDA